MKKNLHFVVIAAIGLLAIGVIVTVGLVKSFPSKPAAAPGSAPGRARRWRVALRATAKRKKHGSVVLQAPAPKTLVPKKKPAKSTLSLAARARLQEQGFLRLREIKPLKSEHGFVKVERGTGKRLGDAPYATEARCAGGHNVWGANPPRPRPKGHWPNSRKIVKSIDDDFELGDDEIYLSSMPGVFAVNGEFVTGVGLWSQCHLMYNWIEYPVPPGARRFTGDVAITDDRHSFHRGEQQWVQFEWSVAVDGKEQMRKRHGVYDQHTQGHNFAKIDLPLAKGNRRLRFRLESTRIGIEGNLNTELVIRNGKFLFK